MFFITQKPLNTEKTVNQHKTPPQIKQEIIYLNNTKQTDTQIHIF